VYPLNEVGAEDGHERVEALGGGRVVSRVVVRLDGEKHLRQVKLKQKVDNGCLIPGRGVNHRQRVELELDQESFRLTFLIISVSLNKKYPIWK